MIKKFHPVVSELFIRGRKLDIYLVFITQLYFQAPKDLRLKTRNFFIRKVPKKPELQQIAINNLSDIESDEKKPGFNFICVKLLVGEKSSHL